ncbi:Anaphase-Promoting Complex Subunit 5 [Manis pentadactyla]|nr:Anaphase-Promoting Complex Subunit 5 [Manis pentadactyla]
MPRVLQEPGVQAQEEGLALETAIWKESAIPTALNQSAAMLLTAGVLESDFLTLIRDPGSALRPPIIPKCH